jgi:hypothetical protein
MREAIAAALILAAAGALDDPTVGLPAALTLAAGGAVAVGWAWRRAGHQDQEKETDQ